MNRQKEKQFEELYHKYYSQVYRYISQKVFSEESAEDLTMDVFFAIWDKFDMFDESKASFQTWLYVIVNNRLKNYYRDRKETVALEDSLVSEVDQADDIMEAIHLQYLRDHLYIALEELSDVQREIVICKYFKKMDAGEISRITGMMPGNVRVHLKRALDKVRDYFNKNNIRWES